MQHIIESGNEYLVAVKANQRRLYRHLQTYFECLKPVAEHTQTCKRRGREEHRCVQVYRPLGWVVEEWDAVAYIKWTQRWGNHQGKEYQNITYYISSVTASPQNWQALVRGHWGIENRLHWPKDVVFGEDDYRLQDESALLNWSILRTIVINLLRLKGYKSLKPTMTKIANRIDVIFSLLT